VLRRTYHAIERMVEQGLLQTHVARSIVRKASLPVGTPSDGEVSTGALADLCGQYTLINDTTYGSIVGHPTSAEDNFYMIPVGTGNLTHYYDWRGVTQIRMLAHVTRAGVPDVFLSAELYRWIAAEGFYERIFYEGDQVTVPLDAVGLHISSWRTVLWPEFPTEERPAKLDFLIRNHTVAGDVGIGLVQAQMR
jgi:hypothetical protein